MKGYASAGCWSFVQSPLFFAPPSCIRHAPTRFQPTSAQEAEGGGGEKAAAQPPNQASVRVRRQVGLHRPLFYIIIGTCTF